MINNWLEPNSPVHKVWKPELYKIQLEAPTPKAILRLENVIIIDNPPYGYEYHGVMNHKKSESILNGKPDGSYLIRQSQNAQNFYTLSLRFGNKTKHFKIYYKSNYGHYLKEDFKRFETIHELVADGLVTFYMQIHAAGIIQEMMTQTKNSYQQSPYMTLNRRKLKALSNDLRKSLKSEIVTTTTTTKTTKTTTVLSTSSSAGGGGEGGDDDLLLTKENVSLLPIATINSNTDDLEILPIYEKTHTFKVHTFKGLNWCEFCANFLWGFTAQGVKCEDCGFIAHNKCSELVPAKCVPDLKRIRGVFGTDLTTLVAAHQCNIPFVIRRCVEEVEVRGMQQEGIYRVSGFADEIDALKMAFDREGIKADISESAYSNINVIAGTLKLYLRLLPLPLITFQTYGAFISSTRCKSTGEQVIAMRDALKQLPPAHLNCLKYIIEHLHKVASHQAVNKMNENNLATVFAPTLIATPRYLTDLSQEIFLLSSLIAHCHTVFMV